ncbi:MAG: diacylglycerol kinase family protein [Nanoarchaeota archaeon]
MKFVVIINPSAGSGMKKHYFKSLSDAFSKAGHQVTTIYSQDYKDLFHSARRASKDADVIVAVGGDGTINHVINGIVGSGVLFGFIPLGSANCIANEFNIPLDPPAACSVILNMKTHEIDLGKVNDRYFLGFASAGFDADLVVEIEKKQHIKRLTIGERLLVVPLYIFMGFRRFFRTRHVRLQMIADQVIMPSGYWILIGNTRDYAGFWKIFPQAKMDDGKLDYIIARKKDVVSALKYFFLAKSGQDLGLQTLVRGQAKEIIIHARKKVRVQADGEFIDHTPVNIIVVPKAIKMIVP